MEELDSIVPLEIREELRPFGEGSEWSWVILIALLKSGRLNRDEIYHIFAGEPEEKVDEHLQALITAEMVKPISGDVIYAPTHKSKRFIDALFSGLYLR